MNNSQSYKGLASLVASRGGGDDTMLVHMTPGEVQGLQSLAMAHGGSLEINPETGLYKAGFLKSILPTLAGAILAPFTGGLSAALLVGAGTGLIEKDWKKGLLAGLGAFGGAGLSSALAGSGASAAANLTGEAAKEASKSVAGNIMSQGVSGAGTGLGNLANVGRGLATIGKEGALSNIGAAVPGIGGAFGGKAAMAAAAAPMLLAEPEPLKTPKAGPTMYYTGTEFEQELNPERNELGQPYFTQRFTPGQFTTQMPGMAEGGKAESSKTESSKASTPSLEEYYKSLLTAPAPRSAQANPALQGYLSNLNQFVTSGTNPSPTYVAPPPKTTPPGGGPVTPPGGGPVTPPGGGPVIPPGGGPVIPPGGGPRPGGGGPRRDENGDPRDLYALDPNMQFDPSILQGLDLTGINPFVQGYTPPTGGNEVYNPQTQKFEPATPPTQTRPGKTDMPDRTGADAYAQFMGRGFNPFTQNFSMPQQTGAETYNPVTQQFDYAGGTPGFDMGDTQIGSADVTPQYDSGLDIYSKMGRNSLADFTPDMMQFRQGGISTLGSYSDGGRLLRGPGDGMSDSIPAQIRGRRRVQPARLADGEFVVPADVVSHLGNGSTDAGAKKLYSMMDKVRRARTKTTRQAKPIKSEKYLPR